MIARPGEFTTEASLETLFDELVDAPGPERDRRIAAMHASDPALAETLTRLLLADAESADRGTGAGSGDAADNGVHGDAASVPWIGARYAVESQLGVGGMGVVWAARQLEPLARPVAIKLLREMAGDAEGLARFDRERRMLARLDHPGIARAFDAGVTDDGRPFIVMERVTGQSIDAWCDEHRASIPRRIEIFDAVCRAVAHAHRRGVVHRDLKASNVLVDDAGDPRIIDFGIAGLVSPDEVDPRLTCAGSWVGTPGLVPPEQLAGGTAAIDTRSDVYALGLLLYELLSGAPAWDPERLAAAAPAELCRLLLETTPPIPSRRVSALDPAEGSTIAARRGLAPGALVRRLDGPLDQIVLKAITRDPDGRYPTVEALRADLERWRTRRPVEATAPSTGARFLWFVRRHRTVAGLMGVAVLSLVTATIVSSTAARDARRSADQAMGALDRAREAESDARANAASAVAAREVMFTALDAATPRGIDATRVPVMDVLQRISDELTDGSLDEAPDVAREMHGRLGEMYERLGQAEAAVKHLGAMQAIDRARGVEPSIRDRLVLADLMSEASQYAPSEAIYGSVLDELGGARAGESGSIMGGDATTDGELQLWATNGLANLLMRTRRFDRALAQQVAAVEMAERLYAPDDPRMAGVLFNHGGLLAAMGRSDAAEPLYRRALGHLERGGHAPTRVRCRTEYGWRVLARLGRSDDAIAQIRMALDDALRTLGPAHAETRGTATHLVRTLAYAGRVVDASDAAEVVLAQSVEHFGHDPKRIADDARWATWAARGAGRPEAAERALAVLKPLIDAHHRPLVGSGVSVAGDGDAGDVSAADAEFWGKRAWHAWSLEADLAVDRLGRGEGDPTDLDRASAAVDQIEALLDSVAWTQPVHRGEIWRQRGRIALAAGDAHAAVELFDAAVGLMDGSAGGSRHWRAGLADLSAAEALATIGDAGGAATRWERGRKRVQSAFGWVVPDQPVAWPRDGHPAAPQRR